jgi:hypothetical protein
MERDGFLSLFFYREVFSDEASQLFYRTVMMTSARARTA